MSRREVFEMYEDELLEADAALDLYHEKVAQAIKQGRKKGGGKRV